MLKNILTMLSGNLSKIIIQSILFIYIARELGVSDFGLLSFMLAVTGIISAFDALGVGNVLLKKISIDAVSGKKYIFTTFFIHAICSFLFIAIFSTVFFISYEELSLIKVIIFSFTELFLFSSIILHNLIYQSLGYFKLIAMNNLLLPSLKLLLVIVFIEVFNISINVDYFIILSALSTTACYFFSAFKFLQVVSFKKDIVWKEITSLIREGFHFAMSKISAIGNMEADKTMLGHFKTHTDVGVYSMSSRLINMALIPMTTVYSVTMPKFFSLGEKGLDRAFDFYLRILSFLLPYGLVVSLSIFLFSDFIIYVLGDDYYEVSNCLEALIFFPVLKIITTGLSDVLTGSGYQKEKSYLQMMALIVNVILNCIFIPTFSWLGAVISLYVSESILFLSYFFVYKRNLSRETLSS
ncbi:oligosaccharide flippase family protein [Vibrio parahaemolyticus]|uniref:oligosaccharide flippase family protein n=1 Tax=Vibrio parahaemolyticus TaxID=670 RepID=UPI000464C46E|nr:oligosaccharide flippase family protein [Vibrio parahaemolyticus]EGQ9052478.1 hypothetical protein [Vibrio parahaemolyticus]EHH3645750.1 oligosaccharide flippase family protein [Vibrio parahaemolyticus]EHH3734912.1 oligosaccharide flippase family protein [Vibrio parahaemolyticus]EHR1106876.1 oligosaccharide flippase family protein [Vibrio parahaemolyticus]EJL7424326.1 oligosaccharide flippase family protein [Vibrio parahaemolyticus]